jgi:SWI/SNF-related matrix-associated actin-dependent regulator of chromatin subfamily A protein 2/4
MLRLRLLKAMDLQARLRALVEKEQQDIMNMNERSYRKFARQCWRQRLDTIKTVSSRSLCRTTPNTALCHPRALNAATGYGHVSASVASQRLRTAKECCAARQEERGRAERAAERIRAIKNWRSEATERQNVARDLRVARNRFVSRAHERLLREMNRQKDDDRTRRMEALKVCPPNPWHLDGISLGSQCPACISASLKGLLFVS